MKLLTEFFIPLLRIGQWFVRIMPFWVLLLILAYLCSNIQVISASERALVYRLGALRHEGTPQVEFTPGVLFAFPEPIDRVQRFKAQKVYAQEVLELHLPQKPSKGVFSNKTLDPEEVGYVLTADRNILHVRLSVQYQITSAEDFFVSHEAPEQSIESLVLASVVQQSGMRTIDDILTNGRDSWIDAIRKTAQQRMDKNGLGISIVSLEIIDLQVPSAVRSDFQDVQSAVVDAQTQEQEAKAYQAEQLPQARGWASSTINQARAESLAMVAKARADKEAFVALLSEDRKLLQSRVYQERLKAIFSDIGNVRFVPPPPKEGMRITIQEKR